MAYKDLPVELALLKHQLLDNTINWEKALEEIKSSTKNFSPWKTTWWEKRREELIKDSCEQCGTSNKEDVFVLQHTWHPSRLQELRSSAYEKYQRQHPFTDEEQSAIQQEIDQYDYINREACPQCSAVALRYRKTFKNWLCLKCNTEFTQPIYVYDERAARDKNRSFGRKKAKTTMLAF
jgi:ribosomal protein L37AE/L43A